MIFTATLRQKVRLQEHVIRFDFAMPDDFRLEFAAGQYLMAEVGDIRRRPYSLESAAKDGSGFSLLIDISPQGIGSKFFESLESGATVGMQGPFGLYRLHPAGSYVFIAGGVGIAPFMPMLAALAESGFPNRIRLVQGAQGAEDLLNADEISVLQRHLPKFEWIKALTQEQHADSFPGRTSEWILQRYEPQAGELVYVCGSPEMVRDCKAALLRKGVDPNQLKIEVFS